LQKFLEARDSIFGIIDSMVLKGLAPFFDGLFYMLNNFSKCDMSSS